jgi:hypothetical protein
VALGELGDRLRLPLHAVRVEQVLPLWERRLVSGSGCSVAISAAWLKNSSRPAGVIISSTRAGTSPAFQKRVA